MDNITKDEFLQGVKFTHKNNKFEIYNYDASIRSVWCKSGELTNELYDSPTVKNSSFEVVKYIFNVRHTFKILFADCFKIENQPKANEKC